MEIIKTFFKNLSAATEEIHNESIKEYNIQEEKLYCPHCGASFTNIDWFNAHLINDHFK